MELTSGQMNVLRNLEPTLKKAEAEGKWLRWAGDSEVVLTPAELRAANANGKYVHGPVNWKLCAPDDLIKAAEVSIERAKAELAMLRKKAGLDQEPTAA